MPLRRARVQAPACDEQVAQYKDLPTLVTSFFLARIPSEPQQGVRRPHACATPPRDAAGNDLPACARDMGVRGSRPGAPGRAMPLARRFTTPGSASITLAATQVPAATQVRTSIATQSIKAKFLANTLVFLNHAIRSE